MSKKDWQLLKAYQATGLTPEEVERVKRELEVMQNNVAGISSLMVTGTGVQSFSAFMRKESILSEDYDLDRLRELVEADREGLAVVLPCHIGYSVYQIISKFKFTEKEAFRVPIIEAADFDWDMIPKIGKSVFLTREEAEAALERMKNNGKCS